MHAAARFPAECPGRWPDGGMPRPYRLADRFSDSSEAHVRICKTATSKGSTKNKKYLRSTPRRCTKKYLERWGLANSRMRLLVMPGVQICFSEISLYPYRMRLVKNGILIESDIPLANYFAQSLESSW